MLARALRYKGRKRREWGMGQTPITKLTASCTCVMVSGSSEPKNLRCQERKKRLILYRCDILY
jgi:hypothetical protein